MSKKSLSEADALYYARLSSEAEWHYLGYVSKTNMPSGWLKLGAPPKHSLTHDEAMAERPEPPPSVYETGEYHAVLVEWPRVERDADGVGEVAPPRWAEKVGPVQVPLLREVFLMDSGDEPTNAAFISSALLGGVSMRVAVSGSSNVGPWMMAENGIPVGGEEAKAWREFIDGVGQVHTFESHQPTPGGPRIAGDLVHIPGAQASLMALEKVNENAAIVWAFIGLLDESPTAFKVRSRLWNDLLALSTEFIEKQEAPLSAMTGALRNAIRRFKDSGVVLVEGEAIRGAFQPPDVENEALLPIPSARPFHELRSRMALGQFSDTNSRFPRATLTDGYAELREVAPKQEHTLDPAEVEAMVQRMREQRDMLSDADVDVLDMLCALWVQSPPRTGHGLLVRIDDLLKMRGLVPHKSGSNRRGGFRRHQRRAVWDSLGRIRDVWIHISNVPGFQGRGTESWETQLFTYTDRIGQRLIGGGMEVSAVVVRPGAGFAHFLQGPGRQIAMLSAQALRYNPRTQAPEKRIARYLAWLWRVNKSKASSGDNWRRIKVSNLLRESGITRPRPAQEAERLEKALDALKKDRVISNWQYEKGFTWKEMTGKWSLRWRDSCVEISPPNSDILTEPIAALPAAEPRKMLSAPVPPPLKQKSKAQPKKRRKAKAATDSALPQDLKSWRKAHGLTQQKGAELLGISRSYLAMIESGKRLPGKQQGEEIRIRLRKS